MSQENRKLDLICVPIDETAVPAPAYTVSKSESVVEEQTVKLPVPAAGSVLCRPLARRKDTFCWSKSLVYATKRQTA